jgi:hypothetical protein
MRSREARMRIESLQQPRRAMVAAMAARTGGEPLQARVAR